MVEVLFEREYSTCSSILLERQIYSPSICQLDLSSTKEVEQLPTRRGISALDFECIEGRYLLSGSVCGTIVVHDTRQQLVPTSEQLQREGRGKGSTIQKCPAVCKIRPSSQTKRSISCLQWYPHDTGMFTSSGSDAKVKVWDTNALAVVEQFGLKGKVNYHTIGKEGNYSLIAVGNAADPYVTLCDMKSGSASHILKGHRKSVLSVDWCPNNEYVLASGSEDNVILIWDIRRASGPMLSLDQYNGTSRGASSKVLSAHNGHVTGLRYTRDGLFLVSCGSDEKLRMWDAASGKNTMVNYGKVKSIPSGVSFTFALSSYGGGADPVICIGLGSNIVLYEAETGTKLKTLTGHYGSVQTCVFHPFNMEVYSGASDCNILVWTPKKKQPLAAKQYRHQNRITGVSVTQDEWSSDED